MGRGTVGKGIVNFKEMKHIHDCGCSDAWEESTVDHGSRQLHPSPRSLLFLYRLLILCRRDTIDFQNSFPCGSLE